MKRINLRWKLILLTTCLLMISGAHWVNAQTLHLITVVDTVSPDIGGKADLANILEWAKSCARGSNLQLAHKAFDPYSDPYPLLIHAFIGLPIGPTDVVIFYFSGHGSTACPNTRAPKMWFKSGNKCFSQTYVHDQLKARNPQLVITIFDCCVDRHPLPNSLILSKATSEATPTPANLTSLLREYRGDLIIASNDPVYGSYSYGDPALGGLFTLLFLQQFNELASKPQKATWASILDSTTNSVKFEALRQGKDQVPYWQKR